MLVVALTLPVVLALINVRLVMTPPWQAAEYRRPGFPADTFGLSTAQRIEHAGRITAWLVNEEGLNALADLRHADGEALLNPRELRHLDDVSRLTGIAFRIGLAALALLVCGLVVCHRAGALRAAILRGATTTLAPLAAVVLLALLGWNEAFTAFHRLFFAGGTWYFAYSDTLIRLFPEQFWFDAVLFLGGFTALQALLLIWLARRGQAFWRPVQGLLYWRRGGARARGR